MKGTGYVVLASPDLDTLAWWLYAAGLMPAEAGDLAREMHRNRDPEIQISPGRGVLIDRQKQRHGRRRIYHIRWTDSPRRRNEELP